MNILPKQTKTIITILLLTVFWITPGLSMQCHSNDSGFLVKDGKQLFPLGFYELPKDDAKLNAMAQAGVNLVRCHSKEDLDRAEAAGMLGIMTVPLHCGNTEKLQELVMTVKDHSALAVWEGPDEIAWNFTAASRLYRTKNIHKVPGAWWKQTPNAIEYAQQQAKEIIPNMREAVQYIKSVDKNNHPFWINEAVHSDLKYVRQYLNFIDITGCDIYPVKKDNRRIFRMGNATERWKQVGRGKPVWMVLQAFAWSELGDYYGETEVAYPTFKESRFMAYDVIAHGARGILYWGSHYLKSVAFRQSIYALTNELSTIHPFLVVPDVPNLNAEIIPSDLNEDINGVRLTAKRIGNDWLVILVNENDHRHMGVVVNGLKNLNGQKLFLLYGNETVNIEHGELITRMMPYEVKVFANNRKWETTRLLGRDFEE